MNIKKSLKNRVRGWFPQEPKMPRQTSPIQTQNKQKPLLKRKVPIWQWAVIFIAVYSCAVSFTAHLSTVQLFLMTVVFAVTVPWVLVRRTFHRTVSKILKYTLIGGLIAVTVFVSTGSFIFYTSGYPPAYVPQISYSNILNASLTECLQSVEHSASFAFLQAEHVGTVAFDYLEIHTYSNGKGWLGWFFCAEDTTVRIMMGGDLPGTSYHTTTTPAWGWPSAQRNGYSLQSIKQSFAQIDALGLDWFFNQAVSEYEKGRGKMPELSSLGLEISSYNHSNYQGITMTLTGRTQSYDNRGYKVYPVIFTAEFQPDGTLQWVSFYE